MRNIYLDYAAATPMDPRVEEAIQSFYRENFGNAGSDDIHALAKEISSSVKQHTGIEIEPEVRIF